jgi:mono/diheme cytochrome c family protein
MNRMIFAALLLAACARPAPFVAPHAAGIDLATGDAARGRAAFIDLRCHVCHRVSGDDALPGRDWQGPVLHDMRDALPETVAWRIVTTTRLAPRSRMQSEMRDTSAEMTRQQLIDLVAYLRSTGGR